MSLAEKYLGKIIIYTFALIFTSWLALLSLFKIIWYGRKYFHVKLREMPPVCLTDHQLGIHRYVKLKEVKLHYVEAGDSSKPLMLLVHGFPEFWYSWRYQLQEFCRDYWVIAIDLRGYGDSDKPKERKAYTTDKLVKDLEELIPALGRESGIVVAHDWGGVLCWMLAMKRPDLVNKLIIMNSPHPGAYRKLIRSNFKQLLMSWYVYCFQLPYLPECYLRANDLCIFEKLFRGQIQRKETFCDHDIEAFKYTFSRPGAFTAPVNYYRNITFGDKGTFGKITVPVLIIWGTKDVALNTQLAHLSSEFVEDCTVKLIEGASHWVQQDAIQLVNQYMREFVTEPEEVPDSIGLVRKVRNMRKHLVSSVSEVMRWGGKSPTTTQLLGYKQRKAIQATNFLARTVAKQVGTASIHVLRHMSGAPIDDIADLILFS